MKPISFFLISRSQCHLPAVKKLILFSLLVIWLCSPSSLHGQVTLWGMTEGGGPDYNGTIFEFTVPGSNYIKRHEFDYTHGAYPEGSLLQYGNKFYGMTAAGGDHANEGGPWDGGVIFEFDPQCEGSYSVLHHFDNVNGSLPPGGLIEVNDKFYGMAKFGGNNTHGVLFEFDPSINGYNVLHFFDYPTGMHPNGSLITSNGKLFGMTEGGGSTDHGVIFEYDISSGLYIVLHHFDYYNGAQPESSLLESNSKLYGMTSYGGSSAHGVLFCFNPGDGTYTVLHHFQLPFGGNPLGDVIVYNGILYGLTIQGGLANKGVLFEYDPAGSGTYNVLEHFTGSNGSSPAGSLTVVNNRFYGTTNSGGLNDMGTIFEYDPAVDILTVVKDFDGSNGSYPLFIRLVPETPCSSCDPDDDWLDNACDNCPDTFNPDQADSDCDGVGDVCDQCPGGDDSIDHNQDGEPDCQNFPGIGNLPAEWLCGNDLKVVVCHNGEEICVSVNAVQAHLAHGDYLGSCNQASCETENFMIPNSTEIAIQTAKNEPNNLLVYPNPANREINVEIKEFEEKTGQLFLYDVLGKRIWTKSLLGNSTFQIHTDKMSLTAGTYWLFFQMENEIQQYRLIIY